MKMLRTLCEVLCKVSTLLMLVSCFAAASAKSTEPSVESPFWPGATYNKNIPDMTTILGHAPGEKISAPDEIISYIKALAAAAPERTKLVTYAQSWQGRPLVYLVISSKQNMSRLENIQANMQRLAKPKNLSKEDEIALVQSTPPVSWLSYGVHGDEISSSDAALFSAYHLLASDNSAEVSNILKDSVVIIDPSQNPDGRSRFVEHYRQTYGIEPASHQLAAEHLQPWPGGRTNHYLFDMNRDWFAQTQPEVQGRIKHYLLFQPVVYVDAHEMSSNESYYFPPPTEPFNPHITETQKSNLNLYGKGNAAAFDRFNFDYFTREIFDAYYPGYGDTWPGFHGAIGMTFEMASARGMMTQTLDGKMLSYRDGVHRHFLSSLATMLTTARNRQQLLGDFVAFRRSAAKDKHSYIVAGGDHSLQLKMVNLLRNQGVIVQQASTAVRACGESYPKDTFVIDAGQASGRLVRTMMDTENPIAKAFWQEQQRRRSEGLEVELYDILAWSFPVLFNLKVDVCTNNIDKLTEYRGTKEMALSNVDKAKLAYLVPWGEAGTIRFLSAALRAGIVVHGADKSFTLAGREYAKGTLIIKIKENLVGDNSRNQSLNQSLNESLDQSADVLHKKIRTLASKAQVQVFATDSAWTTKGINFGSPHVKRLYAPKIALAWDQPTISYAAGNTRFVIEQQMGYPTTPIRTQHLGAPELADFNVLVLPDSYSYKNVLGESGLQAISQWVENGGTLITLGRATKVLLADGMALLDTSLESKNELLDSPKDMDAAALVPKKIIKDIEEYNKLIHSNNSKPDGLPGVLLRGVVNQDHWLSGGVADTLNFMVVGSDIYSPLKHGSGINLVNYNYENSVAASDGMWAENKIQLAHKPALMTKKVGRGQVVAFTSDPAFRAYLDGLNVLLANAIFKGPAHTLGR